MSTFWEISSTLDWQKANNLMVFCKCIQCESTSNAWLKFGMKVTCFDLIRQRLASAMSFTLSKYFWKMRPFEQHFMLFLNGHCVSSAKALKLKDTEYSAIMSAMWTNFCFLNLKDVSHFYLCAKAAISYVCFFFIPQINYNFKNFEGSNVWFVNLKE